MQKEINKFDKEYCYIIYINNQRKLHAGIKIAQLNDSSHSPNILYTIFQFLVGSFMDINKLCQYVTKFNMFNLINITFKNLAIDTRRLWRHPILEQLEIVCTVAILLLLYS